MNEQYGMIIERLNEFLEEIHQQDTPLLKK